MEVVINRNQLKKLFMNSEHLNQFKEDQIEILMDMVSMKVRLLYSLDKAGLYIMWMILYYFESLCGVFCIGELSFN